MQPTTPELPRRSSPLPMVGLFVGVSVLAHAVSFGALSLWVESRPRVEATKPIELTWVEVEPPKPPEPEPVKEPEPPKPEPKKPPIKVASVEKAPPPPQEELPPPPNEPAPEPEAKPPPLVVGVQLSSTTSAGGFAAPVGNTSYGKADTTAKAPSEVKPYAAPKYAPIYQVDREPSLEREVRAKYPDEAKRAGIEGSVLLAITISDTGDVIAAKVLKGLGYGLDEAALTAIRKFRFKPATKNGEAVSTDIKYAYTFLLD